MCGGLSGSDSWGCPGKQSCQEHPERGSCFPKAPSDTPGSCMTRLEAGTAWVWEDAGTWAASCLSSADEAAEGSESFFPASSSTLSFRALVPQHSAGWIKVDS